MKFSQCSFHQVLVCCLVSTIWLSSCAKKFEIQDVDPSQPGKVRSLGPESQDVISVAEQMTDSILANNVVRKKGPDAIFYMLPMDNNSSMPLDTEVFSTRLKARISSRSGGTIQFVSRDLNPDIMKEREMKRDGEVDYDPELRALVPAGADFFIKGRIDDLPTQSKEGRANFVQYHFKLVDAETGVDIWQEIYETKREGRDDLIYR